MNQALEKRLTHLQCSLSSSFDIVYRHINIHSKEAYIIFLSSLSDSSLLADLVESFVISAGNDLCLTFYPGSITHVKEEKEAITNMLSGQSLVLLEDSLTYYCIETRSYPSRSSGEPSVEKSVRGAHDGFVENIMFNIGLLRRRIRDPKLQIVLHKAGTKTKTDIAIAYIEHLVDPDILADFEHRMKSISNVEITSERSLCEELYGKTMNPYPHVRYSERPDICAIHLLQGYLIVIVDNSPSAMILPTTFFEQIKQIEEYTQTTLVAIFTRVIRFTGILFSLYLLPLWIALVIDKNPTMLHLPMHDIQLYEFAFQIIFADIVVEWLRQALIHTPSILSSIMGFIAVFILGDMAIGLGAYTEEILIMIALCNIGNLLTPSYELSLANKVFRIFMSILALSFGICGFCIGVFIHLLVLLSTKTIKYPYLYPLIPFSYKEFKRMWAGKLIHIKKK